VKRFVLVAVLCAASVARAETVAIIADEPLASALAQWFRSHGRDVVPSGLSADLVNTMRDCFVIEDPGCARGVIERNATAHSVAFVTVDHTTEVVTTHWLVKGQPPTNRREKCAGCTEVTLRDHVIAKLAQLSNLPVATPTPRSKPESSRSKPPPPPSRRQAASRTGLAIGAEVGEPTSATAAWFRERISLHGGFGTGTFGGLGISLHAGAQLAVTELAPHVPLRVGLGGRVYHHGYEVMSIDELPDTHYGLFASANVALERGPVQFYAQLAPGIDVARTRSCTLERGPSTICPHAQEVPVFVHFTVGVRWFLHL
jgi:hypothetical protein